MSFATYDNLFSSTKSSLTGNDFPISLLIILIVDTNEQSMTPFLPKFVSIKEYSHIYNAQTSKLFTKLHCSYVTYKSGRTRGAHIPHLNQSHIQGPAKGGTHLLGLHWGLRNLPRNDPACSCCYPPYTAQGYHKACLLLTIVPKMRFYFQLWVFFMLRGYSLHGAQNTGLHEHEGETRKHTTSRGHRSSSFSYSTYTL